MGEPARGYSWPPFEPGNRLGRKAEPGNELAVKHGAYQPARYEPRARAILDDVRASLDWWQPADEAVAWRWACAMARIEQVENYLAELGPLDADGGVRAAMNLLLRLDALAANLAGRLGLDPLSRARLGRDVAASRVDLARLFASDASDDVDGVDTPDDPDARVLGPHSAASDDETPVCDANDFDNQGEKP